MRKKKEVSIKEIIFDSYYTFKQLIVAGILFGVLFTGIFFLIILLYPYPENQVSFSVQNLTIEKCDNLTQMTDAVYCYRNYLSLTYKYVQRENVIRTLEDVQENGGDCYSYTHLYDMILRNRGFKTKVIDMFPDDDSSGHAFLVVWDKNLTNYCDVDMMNVECFQFIKNESIKNGEEL